MVEESLSIHLVCACVSDYVRAAFMNIVVSLDFFAFFVVKFRFLLMHTLAALELLNFVTIVVGLLRLWFNRRVKPA